jgi:predicted PurR-regulated permease PerM
VFSVSLSCKIIWLVLGNILLLAAGLWLIIQLQGLLWLIFVAFILGSALLPGVELLERLKMPNWLAVLLPFLLFVVLVVLLVLPISVLVLEQMQLLSRHLPDYWQACQQQMAGVWEAVQAFRVSLSRYNPQLSQTLNQLNDLPPRQLIAQSGGLAVNLFAGLSGATLTVSRWFADGLSVFILSLLMLIDRSGIVRFLLSFIPRRHHPATVHLVHQLARGVGSFVNSQVVLMVIGGALTTVGLQWMNFPFAVLFGVLTGAAFALPLIGPTILMVPAMVLAWLTPAGQGQAWGILVLYIAVQFLQNNIIGPALLSKTLGLHPLAIIIAVMAGGVLGGIPGIVLSIPVLTCLNVLMTEYRSWQSLRSIH